jgi:AcrR family transcriptional regulator
MMQIMQVEGNNSGLRRDAARNRQRLIDAAGEVLREQGLDAPLDEIARRAGVGNATLYRHFPTRERLYEAVFARAGETLERVLDRAMRIDDPWIALATYFDEACAFIATDQGLCDLMMQGMPGSPVLNEFRVKADTLMQTLLDRAQERGVVRADIRLTDVLFILFSLLRVVPASAAISPDAWRRHLAITLDGLRPRAGSGELPPTSLDYEQLVELGQHFHQRRLHPVLNGCARSD